MKTDDFSDFRPIGWVGWGMAPRHEGVVHLFGRDYDLWSTAGRISGITPVVANPFNVEFKVVKDVDGDQ